MGRLGHLTNQWLGMESFHHPRPGKSQQQSACIGGGWFAGRARAERTVKGE